VILTRLNNPAGNYFDPSTIEAGTLILVGNLGLGTELPIPGSERHPTSFV
jgi:hypothetical protein